ncbi:MAG TPA: ATP synthase F1 subunit epsilon [Acidimicrobiia bacterium]|nr:ATP synthase F1 subunit epsilon [Acidimicrobiia bacterium]
MTVPEHPKGSLREGNIADELAAGQQNLSVVVVSPAGSIYEGAAHWVTVPGQNGQLGIWPRHAELVAALGAGPLRIGTGGDQVTRFAVRGGFVRVGGNRVTVLVDRAVRPGDVNEAEARRELEETLAELQHPRSDAEFADLLERRAWSETRLRMAGASAAPAAAAGH